MAVIVTPNSIIIASDGVLTSVTNGVSASSQFCKIHREGHIFYGAVGDYGVPGTKSDVWAMTRRATTSAKTMLGIYDIIEQRMFCALPGIVKRNKIGDPKTYKNWLSGVPVTSIVFASFESGEPVAVNVSFYINAKGRIVKPATRHTLYAIPGQLNTGRLGYTNEMNAMISSPSWSRSFLSDPIGATRDLIQSEIDASTREKRFDVGVPISIVRIFKQSNGWEPGYEGACTEKQK